jgi:hypothetical protein
MKYNKLKTARSTKGCVTAKCFAGAKLWNPRKIPGSSYALISIFLNLVMILGACGTSFEKPDSFDNTGLRNRSISATEDGIRVSATIPSLEESRNIFGIDLEKEGIQPLWLEIENNTDRQIFFLPTGLDPEYFSPREVAFGFHRSFSKNANEQIDEHIESLSFRNYINPHSTSAGFVFTYIDENIKLITLDLFGQKWTKSFTLFVPTPNRSIAEDNYERVLRMVASSEIVEVKEEVQLRELLEQLPCCTSSEDGVQSEPLNIVLIGSLEDLSSAFWRRNYRHTQVDSRYVFQRPQDFSVSKRDRWLPAQPHVMRAWLTTIRFQSRPVWIGQVSTPLGGRFAPTTDGSTGSYIEPFVDEARNDLIQDIIFSQSLAKMGFVQGVGLVMASKPRKILSGGFYHTDGLRAVLIFQHRPVSISGIKFLDWEQLSDHFEKQFYNGE